MFSRRRSKEELKPQPTSDDQLGSMSPAIERLQFYSAKASSELPEPEQPPAATLAADTSASEPQPAPAAPAAPAGPDRDEDAPFTAPEPSAPDRRSKYAELGSNVSEILSAAEEAGAKIRDEAKQEADRILREAENEAGALKQAAARQSEKERLDLEEFRQTVERHSERLNEETTRKSQTLLAQAQSIEKWLERFLPQLRESVRRLEGVGGPEAPRPSGEGASLDEALQRGAKKLEGGTAHERKDALQWSEVAGDG
jgi:cell division septum initiation protein DivIVA